MAAGPLTRGELDAAGCDTPGCGHANHPVMFLHPRCHPSAGTRIEYRRDGVLRVSCRKCAAPVAAIAVASSCFPEVEPGGAKGDPDASMMGVRERDAGDRPAGGFPGGGPGAVDPASASPPNPCAGSSRLDRVQAVILAARRLATDWRVQEGFSAERVDELAAAVAGLADSDASSLVATVLDVGGDPVNPFVPGGPRPATVALAELRRLRELERRVRAFAWYQRGDGRWDLRLAYDETHALHELIAGGEP